MNEPVASSYQNPKPYIAKSLSEIYDLLSSFIGGAPKMEDRLGHFPYYNIDTRFAQLVESFGVVREKLGEERYARLVDLAARTKALYLEDPDDTNGKTMEGIKLVWEMEEIIQDARKRRMQAKLPDDDGEVTGD